jgi:hypothetical protein
MHDMKHMRFLTKVTEADIACIIEKEKTYKGSWKRRGGIGAAMMTLRKIDRLEELLNEYDYDIFRAIEALPAGPDGSTLAEVRDLRRYLILIEAEMLARQYECEEQPELFVPGTPEDGGHHARQEERLEDGLEILDIPQRQIDRYIPILNKDITAPCLYIVNRWKVPKSDWEHLPQLNLELNNKEWEEIQPVYKSLYDWQDAQSKWLLKSAYQNHWAKE